MKSIGGYRPYGVMYIDGMNLLSRSYFGMSEMEYRGHRTGMLYGVSRLILDWRKLAPGIEFVFIWEGRNSWRKKAYPIYKAQRHDIRTPEESNEFFDGIERIKACLPVMGVSQVWADTYEADDVVATLAPDETRKALFSSGDWDWWELIPYGDILYQHSKVLTKGDTDSMFLKKFNANPVPPDKLWLFKVLTGDPSDNVSGVYRFPKKLASQLCNSGVTDTTIIPLLRKAGKADWAQRVKANEWVIKRNVELLKSSVILKDELITVDPQYSTDGFGAVLLENGMESLYDRLKRGY